MLNVLQYLLNNCHQKTSCYSLCITASSTHVNWGRNVGKDFAQKREEVKNIIRRTAALGHAGVFPNCDLNVHFHAKTSDIWAPFCWVWLSSWTWFVQDNRRSRQGRTICTVRLWIYKPWRHETLSPGRSPGTVHFETYFILFQVSQKSAKIHSD